MIKKITLFFVALIAAGLSAKAQHCGTDKMTDRLLAANPALAQRVANGKQLWAQSQSLPNGLVINGPSGAVYEIPVVIHVMNPGTAVGTPYNPSDAQLIAMIDYLNQAWAATYVSYPAPGAGGTYVPVRFALAKRTSTCGATNGIIRDNLSGNAAYVANGVNNDNTNGINDLDLKNIDRWNPEDYYNIWVVHKIDGLDGSTGGTLGYAYRPPAFFRDGDGIVMLALYAKTGESTIVHEMGHAFGLHHTFQGNDPLGNGSNNCPANANCLTDGDEMCDTQPMTMMFSCPSGTNPCTSTAWDGTQNNFMSYTNCKNRFTPNQNTRIQFTMNTYRPSLVSSLGATPVSGAAPTNACIPTGWISNTLDAGPRLVVLNDMTAETPGGATTDGFSYYDRTCIQQANLNAGQAYNISITTGPSSEWVRVWIDYNNDGTFAASELVLTSNGTTPNQVHTASFTVPTTAAVVRCTPLRMRVVSDRRTSAAPTQCTNITGQTEDYSVIVKGASNAATVSIALTAGTNPSCINTPLTFTATPAGSATSPTYKWYINGTVVAGATGTTFTTAAPANGDVITARIFYTGPCGADSSLSNGITVARSTAVAPTATVTLTSGSNPGCAGQPLVFKVTSTNGGTAPTYIWQTFNGTTYTTVTGATADTFVTTTLPCGNGVRAVLTSSLSCASPTTANSNTITYTCAPVTATATISQTGGTNPTCAGKPVTFTGVVTNPGTTPSYNWFINGTPVPGATTLTFTTTTLNNNDTVQLAYISGNPCVTTPIILSNKIGMTVIPVDTPTVTATITKGSNPGCTDSLLEFTAVPGSAGTGNYNWYLNGTSVSTSIVYSSTTFANGDQVYVRAVAGPGCHLTDTMYSDPIKIVRNTAPVAPVISFIGNALVANATTVQWYGPGGLIPGAIGQSHRPAGPGSYYARALNNGCPSLPSNVLQVSLLMIGNYNLDNVQIYPNPTSGQLNLDWGSTPATARITVYSTTGQALLQDNVKHATRKIMDLSALAAGNYFVVLQDDRGNTGTVRITLMK